MTGCSQPVVTLLATRLQIGEVIEQHFVALMFYFVMNNRRNGSPLMILLAYLTQWRDIQLGLAELTPLSLVVGSGADVSLAVLARQLAG